MRESWPIKFLSIQSTNKSIYYPCSNLLSSLQPLCCSSLDPTDKDGTLGVPTDLVQPANVLALTGYLPGESFDGFFASLPGN